MHDRPKVDTHLLQRYLRFFSKLSVGGFFAWPMAAFPMSLIISGTPIIDYELTGSMVIESGGGREEVAASFDTFPQQLSPYPNLIFKSSFGTLRLRLNNISIETSISFAEGRKFIPMWKRTFAENLGSGASLPLRCQIAYVDGNFSIENRKKSKEHLEEGVPFPESRTPAGGAAEMRCHNHNLGRLFSSGHPFGAELTRKPLAVRLLNPGSTVCLNIPGILDGSEARLRICATGNAAQARLSYF